MKKLITIIVALNIFATDVKAVHDVWGDFWFDFHGTNATVLSLRNATKDEYSIPKYANYGSDGYVVNEIAEDAFSSYSRITSLKLPESMEIIGSRAFAYTHIKTMTIPQSVTSMGSTNSFAGCDLLTTLVYLPLKAPSNWTATTMTYVPDIESYSSPKHSMNNAQVIEMISFADHVFTYTGKSPTTDWVNNMQGYTVTMEMPELKSDVGTYEEIIPVLIKKNDTGSLTWANVVYRYTITSPVLTVKVNDVSREYGEENPTFTLSYSGFVNGEDESVFTTQPTVKTNATKRSRVAQYLLKVSGGSAKNYTLAYETGILTVNKAPLTAKINNTSRQYGTENPEFKISYTGLKNDETEPRWEEALNIVTSATIKSDVGKYAVTATGTPQNYDLTVENGILIITTAPLTVVANDATRQYFDDNPIFDYTCYGLLNDDDKRVLTSEPILTTEATKTSNVGKYKINLSGATAKNYDILHKQGELTITKRELKVTSHCSRQYGEENPTLPIEYSGLVNNETENVLTTKPVGTTTATKTSAVGNYPITLSGGEATNYSFVYEQGVLTVTKASLSAKVSDASKVYGEQNPSFSLEYNGLKNGETVPEWTTRPTFQTEATQASGVGQYTVKAVNGVLRNYNLEIADGTLSITPAALTIQANNASRMYYEDDPVFGFSCLGLVNNDDVQVLTKAPTYVTDAIKTSSVGKYNITPSGAEAKNYAISYEPGELTITKRPLTVTSHCSRKYGEDNPLLPIEYDGFVNNEKEDVISVKPKATTTATITSPVGNYPITLTGGEATNYSFVYKQGVLIVEKASLSAKVKDATKTYGSQNPTFSIEYSGLKNGEATPVWTKYPTFQTEATQASGVGEYAIKAVNGVPQNYDLEIEDGVLSILPAPLTIQANNASRLYYEDGPVFSYKCSGFVNGDNESVLTTPPTLSSTATLTSNVGTYEIKVGETSSPNYSISYVNGTLTINPRTLKASVGNYERIYNEENPTFEVNYNGFVGNDNESVLREKATANTIATKTSDVGTYTINVTGGSADNYQFSYTSGILTINKAEQTISWDQELKGLNIGDQIELKAVSSSGLPVTYKMETNNYAEIYSVGTKYYLDCKAEGETQIVAVQEGNRNYYSSPRIRKSVIIGHTTAVNSIDNLSVTISSTSFGIRVSNVNMGEVIKVYSADGVLHKSVRADAKTIDIPLTKGFMYIVQVGTKTTKLFY